MKKRIMIQHIVHLDSLSNGMWTMRPEDREVEVMYIDKVYAMVRRKGCIPSVCFAKDLREARP
jgi:hypothetical protein